MRLRGGACLFLVLVLVRLCDKGARGAYWATALRVDAAWRNAARVCGVRGVVGVFIRCLCGQPIDGCPINRWN